jgi:hypothetical protein
MAARTDLLEASGFQPSQEFLGHVQRIDALNVFARAFPLWVRQHGKTASFTLTATTDGGVEIDMGLPASANQEQAQDLLLLLQRCQRLAHLEVLVSEMRGAGVDDAIVQRFAIEGETLARQLYGRPKGR